MKRGTTARGLREAIRAREKAPVSPGGGARMLKSKGWKNVKAAPRTAFGQISKEYTYKHPAGAFTRTLIVSVALSYIPGREPQASLTANLRGSGMIYSDKKVEISRIPTASQALRDAEMALKGKQDRMRKQRSR